jgi:peptidoglycan/xylan/chitin deacetylase (PgdA/CDA1 family)
MYYGIYSRPKCVISFDDGWSTQYTEGFAYMKPRGLKATMYIVSSYVGQASRVTTAQLQEMYDAGWDIANHTTTHTDLSTLTQAQVESELFTCQAFIINNGWSRYSSPKHVAYPFGGYSTASLTAMSTQGMLTGRTTSNRIQANQIDNPYLLARQYHDYTFSAATYKGWVDTAIATGGCLHLNYHKIVADATGAADTEVEQTQFRDIMNYILSKKEQIDVVTFSEWYKGITNSRNGIVTNEEISNDKTPTVWSKL